VAFIRPRDSRRGEHRGMASKTSPIGLPVFIAASRHCGERVHRRLVQSRCADHRADGSCSSGRPVVAIERRLIRVQLVYRIEMSAAAEITARQRVLALADDVLVGVRRRRPLDAPCIAAIMSPSKSPGRARPVGLVERGVGEFGGPRT